MKRQTMMKAAERVAQQFAKDDPESEQRRIQGKAKKPADTTLVIHFTPRSGSSWLSSILESTNRLGIGLELFNPNFVPNIARHYGARSLAEYVDMARHFSARGGVLSFEITSHQLAAVFEHPTDFFDTYAGCPSYWLIREDIVSQAVSLSKMVQTKISHAPQAQTPARQAADAAFAYDGQDILKWLKHILAAERRSEQYFKDYGIAPFRMSYEGMIQNGAHGVLSRIAKAAGLPALPDGLEIKSAHEKIATPKNDEFSERFRQQHRRFLSDVGAERAQWIDKARKDLVFGV